MTFLKAGLASDCNRILICYSFIVFPLLKSADISIETNIKPITGNGKDFDTMKVRASVKNLPDDIIVRRKGVLRVINKKNLRISKGRVKHGKSC